jgi:PPOX class probable F420-dependent enzyme
LATVQFSGHGYINLESYTAEGEARQTIVQSLEHDDLIYFRTDPDSWKAKRIKGNSHVRVMLSNRKGACLGDWVAGEAHVLVGQENEEMLHVFRKEYGVFGYSVVTLMGRLKGLPRMDAVVSVKLSCSGAAVPSGLCSADSDNPGMAPSTTSAYPQVFYPSL